MTDTASVHDAMPFSKLVGVEIELSTPDEVRARLDWDATRCTTGGALHGGALMALADTVGGVCAFLNLPDGAAGTTTIESKTNFLRAVRQGAVHASARPLHRGRTIVVIETDLRDDDGRLVGRTTQTQAVLAGG